MDAPIRTVRVLDKRLDVNKERVFGVYDGAQEIAYNVFPATSFDNSTCTINNCAPSDPSNVLAPDVRVRMTFSVNVTGTVDPGKYLLNIGTAGGTDAPRAYPISQVINTVEVQINGSSISTNLNQYFNAFTRVSNDFQKKQWEDSITPTMLDQFPKYSDGTVSVRNPLLGYASNPYEIPRGAFPMTVTGNTINATGAPVVKTATVTFTCTEQLFIAPFTVNSCGLPWIDTLSFLFTFGDLRRVWSHDNVNGTVIPDVNWTVNITALAVLTQTLQPRFPERIAPVVPFAYYEVQQIVTQLGVKAGGASDVANMQAVNLNAVPETLYFFVGRQRSDWGVTTSDTYARIDGSFTINWANNQGKLSNATIQGKACSTLSLSDGRVV